jgi:CheY-like chemotaxis protein
MKPFSIVIVENDEDERYFMSEEIEASEEFRLLGEFVNGDTLIEWLDQHPSKLPDLILSDLNMPGKNGYDILSILKSSPEFSAIPIFITSTSSVVAVRERCLSLGASEFLLKPEIFTDYKDFVKTLFTKLTDTQH